MTAIATIATNLRLPVELAERLNKAAEDRKTTKTALVIEMISKGLEGGKDAN